MTERRDFSGWVMLLAMFGLMLAAELAAPSATKARGDAIIERNQAPLRQAVLDKTLLDAPLAGSLAGASSAANDQLDTVIRDVDPLHRNDPGAAAVYAVARTERGRQVSADDLSVLRRSPRPEDRALAEIYGSDRLSRQRADQLGRSVGKRGFLGTLARVHALEKANARGARDLLGSAQNRLIKRLLIVGGALLLLLVSTVLWATFFAQSLANQLPKLGLALQATTPAEADRLALRGAQLLGIFLLLSNGLALALRGIDHRVVTLIAAAGMLFAVRWLFRRPIGGRPLTLSDLGIRREHLGRHALIGLAAFAMELPVAAGMAVIGQVIFSRLPAPTHPASTALMNSHDTLTVVSIVVYGAVMAPIWEEILFRGLLLSATTRLAGSVLAGGLITSLVFASIHPQGIPLWMALASVGGASCILTYYTRSLVPSIVMHAAHNFTLLILTILMS